MRHLSSFRSLFLAALLSAAPAALQPASAEDAPRSARWTAADKQETKAQKALAKADQRVAEGRRLLDKGEGIRRRYQDRADVQRDKYHDKLRDLAVTGDADDSLVQARALVEIGEDWERATDYIDDGDDLISRGRKLIASGGEARQEAVTAIAEAQTIKREVQLAGSR